MFYVPRIGPKQEVLTPGWTGRLQRLAEDFEAARSRRPKGILRVKDYLTWRFERGLAEVCTWIGNGKLKAKAIPVDDGAEGRAREIVRSEIVEHMTLGGRDGLLYQGAKKSGPAWKSVEVWWPDFLKSHARAVEPVPPTAKAENDCYKWLKGLMNASPTKRPKPKVGPFKDACAIFPGLGHPAGVKPSQSFERAWSEALIETGARWSKAGAPRKSPQ